MKNIFLAIIFWVIPITIIIGTAFGDHPTSFNPASLPTLTEREKVSYSEDKNSIAKRECQKFIRENAPSVGGEGDMETTVFDIYEKKGKLVVEVGYKQGSYGETYTTRLCIIDNEKGTISSPSVFNQSEWSN